MNAEERGIEMEIKGGYTKKILNIDLTRRKSVVTETSDEFALKYIGGRGGGDPDSVLAIREDRTS